VSIYGYNAMDGVATPYWLVKSMDSNWGSAGMGKVAIGTDADNSDKGDFELRQGPFVSALLFPAAMAKDGFTLGMTPLENKNCPWGITQITTMQEMEVAAKLVNAEQELTIPLFALGSTEA